MQSYIKTPKYRLYYGDCLEIMPQLKAHTVDLIVSDSPYGTTSCAWDSVLPLNKMWEEYLRLTRSKNTPIILFANMRFAVELIKSNPKMFKHEWVWKKSRSGSAITAKTNPLRIHEFLLVFCQGTANYYPLMTRGESYSRRSTERTGENNHHFGIKHNGGIDNDGKRYPVSIQHFKQNWSRQQQVHPTQKPVSLLEYVIKTYSKENNIVLDNTMGSGTTGIACINTNRRFIGIESDKKYFKIACSRIEDTQTPLFY